MIFLKTTIRLDAIEAPFVREGDFDTGNRFPLVLGARDIQKPSKINVKIWGPRGVPGHLPPWRLPPVAGWWGLRLGVKNFGSWGRPLSSLEAATVLALGWWGIRSA